MNKPTTPEIPAHCDGCERACKYSYTRIDGGRLLPTISGEAFPYYIRHDGKIVPAHVTSPIIAQQLAHLIAQSCDKRISR